MFRNVFFHGNSIQLNYGFSSSLRLWIHQTHRFLLFLYPSINYKPLHSIHDVCLSSHMYMELLCKSHVLFIFNFMVFFIFPTNLQTKCWVFYLELEMFPVRHMHSQCVDSSTNRRYDRINWMTRRIGLSWWISLNTLFSIFHKFFVFMTCFVLFGLLFYMLMFSPSLGWRFGTFDPFL